MTAPATHRPVLHLVNPPAGPTDAWIQAVARILLSAADRQLAQRAAAADGESVGAHPTAGARKSPAADRRAGQISKEMQK